MTASTPDKPVGEAKSVEQLEAEIQAALHGNDA